MKFQLSVTPGNVVTGHGPGWVRVGMTEYRENLVLTAEAVTPGWAPGGFDALGEGDFARLLDARPDVVLLGTGRTIRFPHPRLTARSPPRASDSRSWTRAAACRTFNILSAEGRRVAADQW